MLATLELRSKITDYDRITYFIDMLITFHQIVTTPKTLSTVFININYSGMYQHHNVFTGLIIAGVIC